MVEAIKKALEDLEALVTIVAKDTGALVMSDPDEESVGSTLEGDLEMTFGHVRRAHAAVSALEAALSTDAEPVAEIVEANTPAAELPFGRDVKFFGPIHKVPIGTKLYAAPPAPSLAVKDLEWDRIVLGERDDIPGLKATNAINQSYYITERNGKFDYQRKSFSTLDEAKAAAQADYEARIRSALSAQVQDVAGWQSMDSAPKDGKHCLLAVKSDCFVYALQGAFMMGEWSNAADIKSEPLCWMPLTRIPQVFLPWTDEFAAAAPATKQGEARCPDCDGYNCDDGCAYPDAKQVTP